MCLPSREHALIQADANASAKVLNIFETKEDFEKKDKNNRYDRSSFEGVYLICRLWGQLSLQVGEINAENFVMGRNMA